MAEAVSQAIAEIRALTGWFLAEGCPALALWGTSMGAGLTGITLCREPRIAAAVLTVPTVRNANAGMVDLIIGPIRREAWRAQFQADEALDATPLNLTLSQPVIPRKHSNS